MRDQDEEFVAVALSWQESDRLVDIEVHLMHAAEKGLAPGTIPTIMVCDELERTIAGFESSSRVFFFNRAAWCACQAAGIPLNATRRVRRAEMPTNYILLAGPSSEAPQGY